MLGGWEGKVGGKLVMYVQCNVTMNSQDDTSNIL